MHQHTRVEFVVIGEGKKGQDAYNIKAAHAIEFWASIDKCTIIAGWALSPRFSGLYLLTAHAINYTRVTWGIEGCGSRGKE